MLEIAAQRGIQVVEGAAEKLPFYSASFDGVLMVLVLCFVTKAGRALDQCAKVLRPSGKLLMGAVPSHSPWGKEYALQAAQGHPVYSLARFRTAEEITKLVVQSAFAFRDASSTLFWRPGNPPGAGAAKGLRGHPRG
jgi:ubiquinone/menaquinone biosynthesis C-methylase UbiE